MIRFIGTALFCAAAILAGDLLFRTSLLRWVRPVILTPLSRAAVEAPVQVYWDGPRRMRVFLTAVGDERQDLGVHESPFILAATQFPRAGGYRVDLEALTFPRWIRATRWFQVHAAEVPPKPPPVAPPRDLPPEKGDLSRALTRARLARDKAQERSKVLRDENTALRNESERLSKQVETLAQTQEEDAAHVEELERRLTQFAEENRTLAEENAAIRQRLGSVVPCTVWGYYSFPRPQTIPVTRRILMVSDTAGRVFRGQLECETVRRDDVTAASICFCVGNSWGG
jgi:regulator of replication initiation timing